MAIINFYMLVKRAIFSLSPIRLEFMNLSTQSECEDEETNHNKVFLSNNVSLANFH